MLHNQFMIFLYTGVFSFIIIVYVILPFIHCVSTFGWFISDKRLLRYLLSSESFEDESGKMEDFRCKAKDSNKTVHIRRIRTSNALFCKWYIQGVGCVGRWTSCHKYLNKIRKGIPHNYPFDRYSRAFGFTIPE